MCGIAGIFNYKSKEPVNVQMLRHMSSLIAHRGPDDDGIFVDQHIGFAHRRLSIIDLSESGHQPFSNQDETAWITYNGECYNYKEFYPFLKSKGYSFKSESDTEVILHLYEEYGLDFLNKIEGMFAFAIWDAKEKRLLLVRDRIGIKPLYYYYDNEHLLFASELKAFLADPAMPREIDYYALGNYFRYLSIPDPDSIFQGIKKLLPGHFLVVENETVAIKRYWDVELDSPVNININNASNEFLQYFHSAVSSHMVSDVPVGAFLSGGVDSSTIVSLASEMVDAQQGLNTYSITFKGVSDFDESIYAGEVSKRYHTNHHEFDLTPNFLSELPKIVWHADEPFAVSSAFALYLLSELTSQHTKVVLSGDGADEVFAGYPWRHWTEPRLPAWIVEPLASGLRCLDFLHWSPYRNLVQQFRNVVMRSRYSPAEVYENSLINLSLTKISSLVTKDTLEAIRSAERTNIIIETYKRFDNISSLMRKLYTDLKTTLVSEMLTKVDRMTMAFGLEARVPFLDSTLVSWAFRLPDNVKMHGINGKYVIKKAMEEQLPKHILYRRKHGFNVPISVWLRGQMQDMALDILSSQKVRERGVVIPDGLKVLIDEQASGDKNVSNQIFTMLMLELWFEHYVDGSVTKWQKS